jgi:hypothetical protein
LVFPSRSRRGAKTTTIDGSTELLTAIRQLFAETGEAKLFTAELLDHLHSLDNRPWQGLTAHRLSALLASHDIISGPVRRGEKVLRGYHRRSFETALHTNEDTKCEEMTETSAATNGSGPAEQRSGAEDGQNDQTKAPPDPSPDPAAEAWRQRFLEHMARTLRNPARTGGEAAAIAFDAVAEIWIRGSPQDNPGHCAQCGRPGALVAIKPPDAQPGATWLHAACFAGWHAPRRTQAIEALARYGITKDGLLPCVEKKPR